MTRPQMSYIWRIRSTAFFYIRRDCIPDDKRQRRLGNLDMNTEGKEQFLPTLQTSLDQWAILHRSFNLSRYKAPERRTDSRCTSGNDRGRICSRIPLLLGRFNQGSSLWERVATCTRRMTSQTLTLRPCNRSYNILGLGNIRRNVYIIRSDSRQRDSHSR